jgi:hypothetical protein
LIAKGSSVTMDARFYTCQIQRRQESFRADFTPTSHRIIGETPMTPAVDGAVAVGSL